MSFVEKFRRTPKFVVWPWAVVLSYGVGYLLAIAAMFGIDASPLGTWYSASQTEWFFTGLYLVFCTVFAAVGALGLTWALRWHHAVSRSEIALAVPLWFFWPVWLTRHEHALSRYRVQAAVGWLLFLFAMSMIWKLCMRLIRVCNLEAPDAQQAHVVEARR